MRSLVASLLLPILTGAGLGLAIHFEWTEPEEIYAWAPPVLIARVGRRGRREAAAVSAEITAADCHAFLARGGAP